jgi:2'-5' RNA ligase
MARAFVAVRPPDAVLDAIDARTRELEFGEDARRTPRAQWHITLQFLGDDCDTDAVASALRDLRTRPRDAQLGSPASLGSARRAKVCVLRVVDGDLRELASEIGARMRPLGFEPDARPYTPHLTIARYRRPTDIRALVADAGTEPTGSPWTVGEVVVFESLLGRGPAEHIARAVLPLAET